MSGDVLDIMYIEMRKQCLPHAAQQRQVQKQKYSAMRCNEIDMPRGLRAQRRSIQPNMGKESPGIIFWK